MVEMAVTTWRGPGSPLDPADLSLLKFSQVRLRNPRQKVYAVVCLSLFPTAHFVWIVRRRKQAGGHGGWLAFAAHMNDSST